MVNIYIMLGITFKRVPVVGAQAIELQAQIKRIMTGTLNADDKREISERKARMTSRYSVTWQD